MKVNGFMGRLLVAVGLVVLVIAPSAFSQKGKPAPTAVPLKVEFTAGYSITGDDSVSYVDGELNVRAEFYYSQCYLDTNENKGDGGRRVNLSVVGAGTCTSVNGIPCPGGGLQDVYVATVAGADPAQLGPGQSTQKRLAINWAEGDYSYHLRYNQNTDGHNHDDVRFSCTSAVSPCSSWEASPTGTYRVGLYANPIRGNVGETYLGSLTMPFVMTLTKK